MLFGSPKILKGFSGEKSLDWCGMIPGAVHEGFVLCEVFLRDFSIVGLEVFDDCHGVYQEILGS
jgi:hypothetical protein